MQSVVPIYSNARALCNAAPRGRARPPTEHKSGAHAIPTTALPTSPRSEGEPAARTLPSTSKYLCARQRRNGVPSNHSTSPTAGPEKKVLSVTGKAADQANHSHPHKASPPRVPSSLPPSTYTVGPITATSIARPSPLQVSSFSTDAALAIQKDGFLHSLI